jgi:hypothetical protein
MRLVFSILCMACALVFGCGDDAGSGKQFSSFELRASDNPGLASDVTGVISNGAITLAVPAQTDVTHLIARFETSGSKVTVNGTVQTSGVTANDFSSPVTYTVTAGDGSTATYVVTAQGGGGDATSITAFGFEAAHNQGILSADVSATINGDAISVTVPFGTSVTSLVATFTTGGTATVGGVTQVSGDTANNFSQPVTYTVTAGSSSKTYTVTVTIAPNQAKSITGYSFLAADNAHLSANVSATINGTAIAATVPFGTDVTALVATFSTTGTSVHVGSTAQTSGVTANDFTSPVEYTVTAADGSTATYTVTVTVAQNASKDITAFSFLTADNSGLTANVTATITGTSIGATVPFGTNVTALVATFSTTGASVAVGANAQTSGTTANDFTSPVTYTVTAADNSTKTYTVTVTIAPSPAKDLTAFSFQSIHNTGLSSDVIATITGTSIAATVPFGTDLTGLVATFATTGASVKVGAAVQTSGATPNNFTNPVHYTVTAADGSTKDYTVTVTTALSPAKDITSFAFMSSTNPGNLPANVTATITGTTIAATVPFGTDVTTLVATFATTGASVKVGSATQSSGITANDFTNPVAYTVTAADGSTKTYTVDVTIASNSAKDMLSFGFSSANNPSMSADASGSITGSAITVSVPYGTDPTALIATFTTSGMTVSIGSTTQTSGMTANDFTNPVTYTVTASDGTTQDYTVTVTVAAPVFPSISAITVIATAPDNGTIPYNTGTSTVHITGTHFTGVSCPAGVALLDLDGAGNPVGTHPTSCNVDNDSQITATFPTGIVTNGAAGWPMVVANAAGPSAPSTVTFVPKAGLLISEVLASQSSGQAAQEFFELYNPTSQPIDFAALGVQVHIIDATGNDVLKNDASFTQITSGIAAPHGFLLFRGANTTSDKSWYAHADYSYQSSSAGLVIHGGLYISLSATDQVRVIDKCGWGAQPAPGFEGTAAANLVAANSLQRLPAGGMGNATDTDDNSADFVGPSPAITPMGSADGTQP